MSHRSLGRIFLCYLVLANLLGPLARAQAALRITVIEGEGAINDLRQRVNRQAIVQVTDGSGRPIAGAIVTFTLPEQGASGAFADGSRMYMVPVDPQGR